MKESYEKLYMAVREILIDWDPIGALEDPDCPKDEYDSYIPEICKILANSNDLAELRQKLNSIVEEKMGLAADLVRNSDFAEKLWELRKKPAK